ncbi:MAG: SHOCT domain-containing protein [Candidatus Paceibacterota bacterium]|jgi:putative membrane protein
MWNYYGGHMFGWGGGGFLMMLFFFVVVIAFITWAEYKNSLPKHESKKTALEILSERYAKGEIDREEFETKKKDIKNN